MATPAQITALIAQGDWSNAPGAISPMQLRGILNAIVQSMITGDPALRQRYLPQSMEL